MLRCLPTPTAQYPSVGTSRLAAVKKPNFQQNVTNLIIPWAGSIQLHPHVTYLKSSPTLSNRISFIHVLILSST
jgi:hypothetical protein